MLARMWKPATALTVSAAQRADLEALVRSGKTPQRVVARAMIILAAAEGTPINAIARECGMSRPTVYLWRDRFQQAGIVGLLKDAPRPGRRRAVSPDQVQAVVDATLHTTPPDATQWSVRTMAKAQGLSHPVVHRIWRAHGLQPHRVETCKLSRDPDLVKKLRDVVGVYLHPPAKALVLCVDEKPQVQALDRTEPVLPLRPGIPARQTHDYIRHGTTLVCRPERARWDRSGTVRAPETPHRIPGLLAGARPDHPGAPPRGPSDSRQLREPYTPQGGSVVRRPPPVSPPLRADECLVAQPDRALVRRDHAQADSPGDLPQRAESDSHDRRLRDTPQPPR